MEQDEAAREDDPAPEADAAAAGELPIFEIADDGRAPDALLIDGETVTPLALTPFAAVPQLARTGEPFAAAPGGRRSAVAHDPAAAAGVAGAVSAKLAGFPSASTIRRIDSIAAADAAVSRSRGSSVAAPAPPLSDADAATFENLRRDLAVARERGQLVTPEDLAAYAPALYDSDAAAFDKLRRLGAPR